MPSVPGRRLIGNEGESMNITILGISTGGPKTLQHVFRGLPRLNTCLILVQHMPRFINQSVVHTLGAGTDMDVQLADTGTTLRHGTVYVAPSDFHTVLVGNARLRLVDGEKVNYVRPSIDVTMRSLTAAGGPSLLGIVMTGLGRDGAAGLSHMKSLGATALAQDEASSVIFGMPAAAIETGCVDSVLPPSGIRRMLIEHWGYSRQGACAAARAAT